MEAFQFFCNNEGEIEIETIHINCKADSLKISAKKETGNDIQNAEEQPEQSVENRKDEKVFRIETGDNFSLLEVNNLEALVCFSEDFLFIALLSRCLSKVQAFYFTSFLDFTVQQEANDRRQTLLYINDWFRTTNKEKANNIDSFAQSLNGKREEKKEAKQILENLFTYNYTFIKAYSHLYIKVFSTK